MTVFLLVSMLSASTAFVARPAAQAAVAAVHVAPWGVDGASGTFDDPVRTVRHAVWRARSGDSIVLRGGTYRENVQISGKTVHITSAEGERAIFDGAVLLESWQRSDEDWFVDDWTHQFPRHGDGPVTRLRPTAGYPDQVFVDGRPLAQVLLRSLVEPGTFFHDTARDRIYIGDDPRRSVVEASRLAWGLHLIDAPGSSLRNVTVRRFATSADQIAAIRVHTDDVTVSGVTSELNAAAGISAIGDDVVIASSRFVDNGYLGVHAHQSNTLVVQNSAVTGNNRERFDAWHSAGGIKVTESSGVTIRHNDVSRNGGPGIWTDLDTSSATISFNRVEDNGRSGIEIELSHRVNVVSNLVTGNGEAGVWVLESTSVQVVHNAIERNIREIRVLEGNRRAVSNVSAENNVIGVSRAGRPMVQIDDWTHRRSARQMNVRLDHNGYWVPSGVDGFLVSDIGVWPEGRLVSHTLAEHRVSSGHELSSELRTGAANPFWIDDAAVGAPGSGHSVPARPFGAAVLDGTADELGVASGTRLPIGPVRVSPRR